MAGLVDAIRARLALTSGNSPPDVVLIERHYIVALLQHLAHVECVEQRGALEVDPGSYIARCAGKDLGLSKDMFLTLYAIASKPDGATYREIYDLCKGKGFVAGADGRFEMNVRTMIKRLRIRLRETGLSAEMIESRPRVGYCWRDPALTRSGSCSLFQSDGMRVLPGHHREISAPELADVITPRSRKATGDASRPSGCQPSEHTAKPQIAKSKKGLRATLESELPAPCQSPRPV